MSSSVMGKMGVEVGIICGYCSVFTFFDPFKKGKVLRARSILYHTEVRAGPYIVISSNISVPVLSLPVNL